MTITPEQIAKLWRLLDDARTFVSDETWENYEKKERELRIATMAALPGLLAAVDELHRIKADEAMIAEAVDEYEREKDTPGFRRIRAELLAGLAKRAAEKCADDALLSAHDAEKAAAFQDRPQG